MKDLNLQITPSKKPMWLNTLVRHYSRANPTAGTDLQISGEPDHPDPEIRGGGAGLKKKFFSALRASVWSKTKGGGPPGPLKPVIIPSLYF